jgi:hypothetical protein
MPPPDALKRFSQWEDVSEDYLSVKSDLSVVVQRHQRFIELQSSAPAPAFTATSALAHISSPPVESRTRLGTGPQTQQAQAGSESGAGWKTPSLNRSRFASPVAPSSSSAFPPLQPTSSAEISRRSRAPSMDSPPPRLSRFTSRPPPQFNTQTGPDSPSASSASQNQTSRQPLMTHKQRMDTQERRQPPSGGRCGYQQGNRSRQLLQLPWEHARKTYGDKPQRTPTSKTSGNMPQRIDDSNNLRKSSGDVPRDAAAPEHSHRPRGTASWDLSRRE